jgi:hypothetical protein
VVVDPDLRVKALETYGPEAKAESVVVVVVVLMVKQQDHVAALAELDSTMDLTELKLAPSEHVLEEMLEQTLAVVAVALAVGVLKVTAKAETAVRVLL